MWAVLVKSLMWIASMLGMVAVKAWDLIKWAFAQFWLLLGHANALLVFISMRLTKYFLLKVIMWAAIFSAFYVFVSAILGLVGDFSSYTVKTIVSSVNSNFNLEGWGRFIWTGGLTLASFFSWFRQWLSFLISCEVAYRVFLNVLALKRAGGTLWKEPSGGILSGHWFNV